MDIRSASNGSPRNRIIPLLAVWLLPVWGQGAYAQIWLGGPVSIHFSYNGAPEGDPLALAVSAQYGPGRDGTVLAGGGGLCDFCGLVTSNTPGTSLYPFIVVRYTGMAGAGIDCPQAGVNCYIDDDPISELRRITFPTNGKDFFVTVPAIEGGVFGQFGEGTSFQSGGGAEHWRSTSSSFRSRLAPVLRITAFCKGCSRVGARLPNPARLV